MVFSTRSASCIAAVALASSMSISSAFTTISHDGIMPSPRLATALQEKRTTLHSDVSRRSFFSTIATTSIASATTIMIPTQPAFAKDTKDSLISDLNDSLSKISTIPPLLESAEWDKVRTILKTPPVNQLWNLGESQNTLVKLAKETGDFEIMELKDELAISLQMTDQYSYDNVFIYYQPGNGKVKTKEPLEMANKAISQLKEALDVVSSS